MHIAHLFSSIGVSYLWLYLYFTLYLLDIGIKKVEYYYCVKVLDFSNLYNLLSLLNLTFHLCYTAVYNISFEATIVLCEVTVCVTSMSFETCHASCFVAIGAPTLASAGTGSVFLISGQGDDR